MKNGAILTTRVTSAIVNLSPTKYGEVLKWPSNYFNLSLIIFLAVLNVSSLAG